MTSHRNDSEDKSFEDLDTRSTSTLKRREHIELLIACLTKEIPSAFEHFVPSQTWCVYWITHSLALLEQQNFIETIQTDVIKFIDECRHADGGYGGGPGQIGHLATSFAAVNALVTISTEDALDSIDRIGLVRFLHNLKHQDGSFAMHVDGEIDSRASYCALVILRLLNIQDEILMKNVASWILACQTYEGGFGSVPGSEAHGGYTFCCVASLCLLNQLKQANISSLLRWLTNKQLEKEGGFCGRSNKLVDSCYSFWQGAIFPMIHSYLEEMAHVPNSMCAYIKEAQGEIGTSPSLHNVSRFRDLYKGYTDSVTGLKGEESAKETRDRPATRSFTSNSSKQHPASGPEDGQESKLELERQLNSWMFDCFALQNYVLNSCQAKGGLLKDKPGVEADIYHTCYALSGLSISQHQPDNSLLDIGSRPINLLCSTHPLFNLNRSSLDQCFMYFRTKLIETSIAYGGDSH